MNKKISVVGTVGLPACYGGWETLVDNITKFKSENIDYEVYCSSKEYTEKLSEYNGAKLKYLPLSANGISSIFYDIISLIDCWKTKPDVVLVLGVSGCLFLPIFNLFSNAKVIVNVDGIEWKRNKWNKLAKKFLKLSESVAVKNSDVIIADNKGIYEYLAQEYNKESVVIAYGGEHAVTGRLEDFHKGYFLSICRIEPENNVAMVLESFCKSGENLKFVGNWGASDYGIKLKEKYSELDNIEIIDPVYDLEVLFDLRLNCSGYIHGHSVGGTNPSLVEIMHFGKQVYCYDCIYNRYTTENSALYFIDSESLQSEIAKNKTIINNTSMKEIATQKYTWTAVSASYENMYL